MTEIKKNIYAMYGLFRHEMIYELKIKLIHELSKTASEVHGIPIESFTVIIR